VSAAVTPERFMCARCDAMQASEFAERDGSLAALCRRCASKAEPVVDPAELQLHTKTEGKVRLMKGYWNSIAKPADAELVEGEPADPDIAAPALPSESGQQFHWMRGFYDEQKPSTGPELVEGDLA
jgi:hypothetical protein